MPFDDTDYQVEAIPDLSKPSLEGLEHLIAHPELWPTGWNWDFVQCRRNTGCAMDIAFKRWPNAGAVVFGLLGRAAWEAIFPNRAEAPEGVTPDMVVRALREYRLTGKVTPYLVEAA